MKTDIEKLRDALKKCERELSNAAGQARTAEWAEHYEGYARMAREAHEAVEDGGTGQYRVVINVMTEGSADDAKALCDAIGYGLDDEVISDLLKPVAIARGVDVTWEVNREKWVPRVEPALPGETRAGVPTVLSPAEGPAKPRIKLSPELGDSMSCSIVDRPGHALECVKLWLDEHGEEVGESCQIEIVAMTDAEVEALPPI